MLPDGDDDSEGPIVPAGVHLAPIWRRAVGFLADQLLLSGLVVGGLVLAGASASDAVDGTPAVWATVAFTLAGLIYETVGVWRWGRTLGKLLSGTRVVHVTDGGSVALSAAMIRSLVPAAFSVVPQVGLFLGFGVYLLAFFDLRRQGLHDKAAGTLVALNAR